MSEQSTHDEADAPITWDSYNCYKRFVISSLQDLTNMLMTIACVHDTGTLRTEAVQEALSGARGLMATNRWMEARLKLALASSHVDNIGSQPDTDALIRYSLSSFRRCYRAVQQNGIDKAFRYWRALNPDVTDAPSTFNDRWFDLTPMAIIDLARERREFDIVDKTVELLQVLETNSDPCYQSPNHYSGAVRHWSEHDFCVYCQFDIKHCFRSRWVLRESCRWSSCAVCTPIENLALHHEALNLHPAVVQLIRIFKYHQCAQYTSLLFPDRSETIFSYLIPDSYSARISQMTDESTDETFTIASVSNEDTDSDLEERDNSVSGDFSVDTEASQDELPAGLDEYTRPPDAPPPYSEVDPALLPTRQSLRTRAHAAWSGMSFPQLPQEHGDLTSSFVAAARLVAAFQQDYNNDPPEYTQTPRRDATDSD